jgi:hypothetical protein
VLLEPVASPSNRIAEMQEEIELWSRASLSTCWLADDALDEFEEGYGDEEPA